MKFRCALFLASLVLTFTGCTNPNTSPNKAEAVSAIDNTETVKSISGKVIDEMGQGRDGTVWSFVSDTGVSYSLVLSIPNLGPVESEKIGHVKPNSMLKVTGDVYDLGSEKRLIARKINISQ